MASSCPNYLHPDVSDGKDVSCHQQEVWWATCHDESCDRYSRLQCGIGVSPLLPLPFTEEEEGVLRGQQLRTLCLETELEKRIKKELVVIVRVCCPC